MHSLAHVYINAILLEFQNKIFVFFVVDFSFFKVYCRSNLSEKYISWISRIYSVSNSETITHHFHHRQLPLWHYYFQLIYFSSLLITLPFSFILTEYICIFFFFKDKEYFLLIHYSSVSRPVPETLVFSQHLLSEWTEG